MNTVMFMRPLREVQEIRAKSKNGRIFIIDILKSNPSSYDSTVIVMDKNSATNPGSWIYETKPISKSAVDNFDAALKLILDYLKAQDSTDELNDVHNPCNCPFISEQDQNAVLAKISLPINVRIN